MAEGSRAPLAIERCGPIARELLGEAGETRITALFERSLYLACPRGLVCIGTRAIGAGPINVELALDGNMDWAALGVRLDAEGTSDGRTVSLGDGARLDAVSGTDWLPPPFPAFDTALAAKGLATLRRLAAGRVPADGLATLQLDGQPAAQRSPTARAAAGPLAALRADLPRALARDRWSPDGLRAATLLVGLGPGFTPSGDDVLGGLMLALTAAGRAPLRDALWYALEPELDDLTVPASAMHLSAAADGLAAEPLHLVLAAILSADEPAIAPRLAAVARIGHTSGWDALAGLVMGLDALAAGAI